MRTLPRFAFLAALLAACATPAPRPDPRPEPPDPLAGCEVIRSPFRRRFDCPRGAASVSLRPDVTTGAEAFLDEQLTRIENAEKLERVSLVVGGRPLPALRVAMTVEQNGEERFLDGHLVAEQTGAGLVTADCAVAGRDQDLEAFCRDILPHVLAMGPSLKAAAPPVLLGRELRVPDGCEAESSDDAVRGSITCEPDAALSWTLLGSELEPEALLNEFIHRFALAVGKDKLESKPWSCTVTGQPARCGELAVTVQGQQLHVFVGVRAEAGKFLLAQCNTSRTSPDHAACAGVLAPAK
jgi:hypothetical protein